MPAFLFRLETRQRRRADLQQWFSDARLGPTRSRNCKRGRTGCRFSGRASPAHKPLGPRQRWRDSKACRAVRRTGLSALFSGGERKAFMESRRKDSVLLLMTHWPIPSPSESVSIRHSLALFAERRVIPSVDVPYREGGGATLLLLGNTSFRDGFIGRAELLKMRSEGPDPFLDRILIRLP